MESQKIEWGGVVLSMIVFAVGAIYLLKAIPSGQHHEMELVALMMIFYSGAIAQVHSGNFPLYRRAWFLGRKSIKDKPKPKI